ncbi:hypothetical protein [uncultured Helicobacter sp.]|uniref:hypothetical protein n=1 Tax=uncultured Helicobacter sp. TaxID=175537 RepID=UPI00261C5F3B|nr:hypothetical protein [uncultured Helicobacter sp.]
MEKTKSVRFQKDGIYFIKARNSSRLPKIYSVITPKQSKNATKNKSFFSKPVSLVLFLLIEIPVIAKITSEIPHKIESVSVKFPSI